MDALSSLIEFVLESVGRRKERETRMDPITRVPSLRFQTPSAGWQTASMDLVTIGERWYLLAPGSADRRWVHALRSGASCELVFSSGTHRIAAREVDDRDKPPVLREDAKRGAHGTRGWRRLGDSELRWIGREIAVFEVERP